MSKSSTTTTPNSAKEQIITGEMGPYTPSVTVPLSKPALHHDNDPARQHPEHVKILTSSDHYSSLRTRRPPTPAPHFHLPPSPGYESDDSQNVPKFTGGNVYDDDEDFHPQPLIILPPASRPQMSSGGAGPWKCPTCSCQHVVKPNSVNVIPQKTSNVKQTAKK